MVKPPHHFNEYYQMTIQISFIYPEEQKMAYLCHLLGMVAQNLHKIYVNISTFTSVRPYVMSY